MSQDQSSLLSMSLSDRAPLAGMRLAVVGAGVFGLCTALRAVAAGAQVEVWEPAAVGDNASGVAAGMIAPAGEMLFDAQSTDHFRLFAAGREAWRSLETLAPALAIDRSGARFLFDDPDARDSALAQLVIAGGSGEPLELGRRFGLFTPDDWRVDAPVALAILLEAVGRLGGILKRGAFAPHHLSDYDLVVLAIGLEANPFVPLAPELEALTPIKGHILRFASAPHIGPVMRSPVVYLAPQPSGVLAGATMEVGRADRVLDAEVIHALHGRALGLMPTLADAPYRAFTGVRATTPDGLPLAGRSQQPNLLVAAGARRNGWLLAPLVSQIIVSYLGGGDGGAYAQTFDPKRVFKTR